MELLSEASGVSANAFSRLLPQPATSPASHQSLLLHGWNSPPSLRIPPVFEGLPDTSKAPLFASFLQHLQKRGVDEGRPMDSNTAPPADLLKCIAGAVPPFLPSGNAFGDLFVGR